MPNGFSPVANDESLITLVSALMLLFCLSYVVTPSDAQQTKKSFTVADEIGLTLFGNPNGGKADVHFSPDGKYFAVTTERGLLEINRIEDSLQFYRSQDVEHFVDHSDELAVIAGLEESLALAKKVASSGTGVGSPIPAG